MTVHKKSILLLIVAGTIITGCCNSIFTKVQDLECVENCGDPEHEKKFEQPVLQTLQMFIGEMLCWIPLLIRQFTRPGGFSDGGDTVPLLTDAARPYNNGKKQINGFKDSLILSIPSTCDLLATTLLNVGLLYTPVSIYQMSRGSIILFVGLFSVVFLKRTITRIEWTSLFVVVFGVFLVGLSGSMGSNNVQKDKFTAGEVLFGMSIILLGVMFSATQFVVEEHILSRLEVKPMKLVGFEGTYGALVAILIMLVGHLAVGSTKAGKGGPFDAVNAFHQMFGNNMVLFTSVLIMLSISSFNFFGISLTAQLSATARSTIDTTRTLLVWLVSLCIGWESFKWLQLVGKVGSYLVPC
ncbi:unnamed protein product [Ambrosiozyma monospora]|uniref:Unnamed protein product n=1 Tax=Ambrosiozyma monospora TaxID=43982 RepID=A0ACB5TRH8_AMBMO|nr:unnamed protein product [Ambrosiozyma monospora]